MNKLAAHETEILLGNEAFIDRIVREDGSLDEKVVGKIYRNDAWEVNKKIYQVLKAGELCKKSEVGPQGRKIHARTILYAKLYKMQILYN